MTDQTTNPADAEIMRLATEDARDDTIAAAKDTLELGGDDAPELTDEQKAEAAAKAEEEGKDDKGRSRPWSKRVDVLTARLRETERERDEARAAAQGRTAATVPTLDEIKAKEPKPDDFEFGAADPDFIEARQDWKLDMREAERNESRRQSAEQEALAAVQNETLGKVREGIGGIEKRMAEKYPDFEEKLGSALEARDGQPLPAVATIAISQSPVGEDVLYRLASDEAARERIDSAVDTAMQQIEAMKAKGQAPDPSVFSRAALAFGEIEGEYLAADHDDADLDLSDPLDMMRMNGRMKARLAGKAGKVAGTVRTTKAPRPPEDRARGSAGQFEVGDDTEDFAAFERKIMGKKG
jgi:uncharacterized Ntn-hydrolase superfamily protein